MPIVLTLQNIDIIELKPLQAVFDRVQYVLATEAILVGVAKSIRILMRPIDDGRWLPSHDAHNFGHHDDLISRKIQFFDCLAQNFFRDSV
jgi:hypothetical protein